MLQRQTTGTLVFSWYGSSFAATRTIAFRTPYNLDPVNLLQ
jgi:hypothetical protein